MSRLLGSLIVCLLAGPAFAGSTLLGSGTAHWFYQCANGEPMNILIRHTDRTTTGFALQPGQALRTFVQRGDLVTWRCDARFPLLDTSTYIVTVP